MSNRPSNHETTSLNDPLRSIAIANMRGQIERAGALLTADVVPDFDAFDAILKSAMDAARAWRTARDACSVRVSENRVTTLARPRSLDGDEDRLPSEFQLIAIGEVEVERPLSGSDFVFTHEHATQALEWFESLGRKLAIDYEHQSFDQFNTRPDGLRPAAGWIGGLDVRADGLWATDVVWTERAREMLSAGEYRYFSPVIFWDTVDYERVVGLGPVALTNDPAMKGVPALTAAARSLVAGDDSVGDQEVDSELDLDEQLERAQHELRRLKRQLSEQEADTFVENGLRDGKIVDSTSMDWRSDFLRDAREAVARLSRSPVLLPRGRVVRDFRASAHVDAELEAERADAEDLEAFERALATGRVTYSGRVAT